MKSFAVATSHFSSQWAFFGEIFWIFFIAAPASTPAFCGRQAALEVTRVLEADFFTCLPSGAGHFLSLLSLLCGAEHWLENFRERLLWQFAEGLKQLYFKTCCLTETSSHSAFPWMLRSRHGNPHLRVLQRTRNVGKKFPHYVSLRKNRKGCVPSPLPPQKSQIK